MTYQKSMFSNRKLSEVIYISIKEALAGFPGAYNIHQIILPIFFCVK